jgi:hypothetical protein
MTKEQYEGASEYGHTKESLENIDYLNRLVKERRAQKVKYGDVTFIRLFTTDERVEEFHTPQSCIEDILHHVDPELAEVKLDSNYDPEKEISEASLQTETYKKIHNRLFGTTNRDLTGATGEKSSWDHLTGREY